jgi:stress-induced morphogen
MATEALRELLVAAVPDATGSGDHFQVTVASARFQDLSLLEQHRLVNEALAAPLADGTIHELRIKTKGTA